MKYKVLIDLLKLSNLYCGLGQVSLNFGKAISQISHSEIEWHFLVPEDFNQAFGDNVVYWTKKTIKKADDISLWHSIHQEPKILPKKSVSKLLTIHDLNFLGEKKSSKAQKRLKALQTLIENYDSYSYISEFSKTIAANNLSFNPICSHEVIHNGVEISSECNKPSFVESEDFFFSLGVVKPKKNFHVLLPMLELFPNIKLIIGGDNKGGYSDTILKEAKQRNLSDRVVMARIISESEKNWLYANCKAFLFPSLHEGFGLPLIEALSFGKPTICTNGSSLPEVGSDYASYWDSFDAEDMKCVVEKAMKLHEDVQTIDAAKQYASKFTWKRNAEMYVDLYLKMIKNS